EFYLYHKQVCEELKISKKTFYIWLNTLIEKGHIEPTSRKYIYKLKPYSFIKGDMKTTFEKEIGLN
ncbi:MAG: hypothetical protein ACP5Q5_11440, partial [Brevinematia bacterium]